MLYSVWGLQLFRDYIYITNDNLFSLAFSELREETEEKNNSREAKRFYFWTHCSERIFSFALSHLHSSPLPHGSYGTVLMCSLSPCDALWRYSTPFLFLFGALPCKWLHFSSFGSKAAIFNLSRLAARLAPLNHGANAEKVRSLHQVPCFV